MNDIIPVFLHTKKFEMFFFENFKFLKNDIISSHLILQKIVSLFKLAIISGKL
jgi:hypothetical protein